MIEVILDRILVKPEQLKKTHKVGDIEIAIAYGDSNEDRRREAARVEGEVIAIGPLAYNDLGCLVPPVKVGDHVVFAKYSGVFVKDPETNEDLVVLNDEDVLCIVHKGETK